jgi:hypothetical protein
VPRFLLSGAVFAVVLTTLALFVSSFTMRRAYAAVGTLAVLFVGSAVGGIAEDNFSGSFSDVLSLAALPQVLTDVVHWIFGDDLSDRPVSGAASAGWLLLLTVVLGAWLVRRTGSDARA